MRPLGFWVRELQLQIYIVVARRVDRLRGALLNGQVSSAVKQVNRIFQGTDAE